MTIMKGDRVGFIGKSFDISYGESGIVVGITEDENYLVQFSKPGDVLCFPYEIELLQKWEDYAAGPAAKTVAQALEPLTSIAAPKGAKKNDTAKPDLAYIPLVALEAEAEAFAVGGRKYGAFNYLEGGFTSRRLAAAALRHLYAYLAGEDRCPTDGQLHLGSVRATLAMLLHCQQQGVLVDDRYVPQAKAKTSKPEGAA